MASITLEQRNELIALYTAMFNAAPGASNLNEMVTKAEAGQSLLTIAQGLTAKADFSSVYPAFLTADEFSARLVANMLGSEVSAAASTWATNWVKTQLASGKGPAFVMATAVQALRATTATDFANAKAMLANKTDVASYFSVTKALSDPDLADLQAVISGVTSSAATVTTAKAAVDETGTKAAAMSITLTTGADVSVGGTGNDTISASAVYDSSEAITASSTYTAADSIAAGAGTDTMNLVISGAQDAAVVIPSASVTGLEVLNVRNTVAQTASLDASTIAGITTFAADRSVGAVTVTNLASGATAGMIGDGTAVNGAFNAGWVTTATAATLNISGGTTGAAGAVALTGTGVLSTTVNSTGAANTITTLAIPASSTSLTINSTSGLTTGAVTAAGVTGANLTIAGTGKVTTNLNAVAATKLTISNTSGAISTGTLNNATVTVDASANTGGVTTTLGTSTAMVFTGGAGNDLVTAGAVLGAGAAVNGGAGTDRIAFATGQLTTASGAKYTNFEVLQANGATDIDMDNIAGITALRTNGNATFTNVTATQAAAITTIASGALNIGVKGASTVGQLDTVSITTSTTNTAVAIASLAAGDVETINLTANTGTGLTSITSLAHDDWQFLNLSGAAAITITTSATAAIINTKVDGSAATGVLTLDMSASTTNGVQIIGGSAADVLTGTGQADVIKGGDGADTITGGNGADVLTGGAGADIFISVAAATATDAAGAGIDVITDFNTGGADILRIAAANNVAGAGGTAVATASVVVSAGGKATFGAADDTLAEMIATLVADAAITANEVVFFDLGSDTYVYGAGATADGSDDFMIKLTGITGLTTLTESTTTAGDFTLA